MFKPHSALLSWAIVGVGALVATPRSGVAAQLDTDYTWSASGGITRLSSFDIFDGQVTVRSASAFETTQQADDPRLFSFTTRYMESVNGANEVWASTEILRNNSHMLALRARTGMATTYSSVRGAVLPFPSLAGALSWLAADLIGGFQIPNRRLDLRLFAGPSVLRGFVGSQHRDQEGWASVRMLGADTLFPMLIPWNRLTFTMRGGLVGQSVRLRATDRINVGLTGEYRFAHSNVRSLERDHQKAYGDQGPRHSVSYEPHMLTQLSLSLAFEWRLGARRLHDPGTAAITALSRSAAPDWRDELPAEVRLPLLAGDTAAAIAALQGLERLSSQEPLIAGTLGILLAATATAVETDFATRVRAERLLERALASDKNNPRYLMALGVLFEKRVMHTDARRVLTRGVAAAADRPDQVTAAELAELFFQRGLALEAWVLDFEDLRFVPDRGGDLPGIAGISTGDVGTDGLSDYYLYLQELLHEIVAAEELERIRNAVDRGVEVAPLIAPYREAMLGEFHRALALAPSHLGAHRRILATHVRYNSWPDALTQARAYSSEVPGDPWADVFLGMTLYRTSPGPASDSLFQLSLARLGEGDRRVFEDLNVILPAADEGVWARLSEPERQLFQRAYFHMRNPLYISDYNERLVEHQSRVAQAELLFGEPQRGRRGWDTDRGQILVRYGPPNQVIVTGQGSGGRSISWLYPQPVGTFTFTKQLGRATVRFSDPSYAKAADLKAERPTVFSPPFAFSGPLTVQIARFRSTDLDRHEVLFYGKAPANLARSSADSMVHGLTLLGSESLESVARHREVSPVGDGALNYRLIVSPGTYAYALEAMSIASDLAASNRGSIRVEEPVHGFAASDLLLAYSAQPASPSIEPSSLRDLAYVPLRCVGLPESGQVTIIFELYGLGVQDDGIGRYRVTVHTNLSAPGGVLARVLRGVREFLQPRDDGAISFVREVQVTSDRNVEWFELMLPADPSEMPRLMIEVVDLSSGASVNAGRTLSADCQ
jgi:GWxTD domain-containing protein